MSTSHAKYCTLTDEEKQQLAYLKQFWQQDSNPPQPQMTQVMGQQQLL